jgi:hypothetical protein
MNTPPFTQYTPKQTKPRAAAKPPTTKLTEDKEMIAVIEILIAGLIVYTVGLPLVNMYEKWKKEMDESK